MLENRNLYGAWRTSKSLPVTSAAHLPAVNTQQSEGAIEWLIGEHSGSHLHIKYQNSSAPLCSLGPSSRNSSRVFPVSRQSSFAQAAVGARKTTFTSTYMLLYTYNSQPGNFPLKKGGRTQRIPEQVLGSTKKSASRASNLHAEWGWYARRELEVLPVSRPQISAFSSCTRYVSKNHF